MTTREGCRLESVMSYYKTLGKGQKIQPLIAKLDDGTSILIDEAYCTNPACSCTDVLLRFYEMDEQNEDMKAMFSFRLDVTTWKIAAKDIHNKKIKAGQIIDEFVNNLDNELKNRFTLHWAQSKEYGRKHYLDYIPQRTVDEVISNTYTIPYSDIYGSKDMELLGFNYGTDGYLIIDHYCVQPKCLCQEAHLQFIKINPRKKTQDTFFAVILKLTTCQYTVEEIHCKYEEMASIVNHVIKNKPEMLKVLKRRYSEMKTAGREIINKYGQKTKPQVKTVTTGRNDPCPCGSGKKYKNCCLNSAANR